MSVLAIKKATGNKFCLFLAIVVFAILLTSCGSSSSSDDYAKSINLELIHALNNKDSDLLKSMMSIRTKNVVVEDLDAQISQLFEFIDMNGTEIKDENIIRSECMLRHTVSERNRYYDYIRCDLRIKLDNGKQYYFFTHTYRTNSDNSSVGAEKIMCFDVTDYVFKEGEVTIDTKGLEYVLVGER